MTSHNYSTLLLRKTVFSVNYDRRLQKQAVFKTQHLQTIDCKFQNTALVQN